MADRFYEGKLESVLRSFEKYFKRAEGSLLERFDRATVTGIHDDAAELIEALVPDLPDVGGGDNQFIQIVLLNAWYIPFFKAARERGMSAEEYVKMITGVLYKTLTRCPRFIRHAGGRLVLTGFFIRRMKKHAALSQERKYPKNWTYSLTTDTGDPDALFKVEYSQCTVCEMMKDQDVVELMRYCNVADFLMAKALGFGFENPEVLGRGAATCVGVFRTDRRCEIPGYLDFAFEDLKF